MTKRLLSVALAVLMVLALVPMSVFAQASDADATYELTCSIEAPETVDNPAVGDTLDVYFCISEGSGLESGQFAIEFNHDYLTVTGYNSTFTGSVNKLATTAYKAGTSDKFGCTAPSGDAMNYEGMTGGNPFGEAGHWYANWLCGVTTYEYDGCQVGGRLMRVRFTWNEIPTAKTNLNWNIVIVDACVDADAGTLYTEGNIHVENGTTEVTVPSNTHEVIFSIPEIPEVAEAVGDQFTMYFDVSENSSLYSGQVLIEYDPEYLECLEYGEEDWEEGLTGIYDTLVGDDEDPGTDRIFCAVNPAYVGGSGTVPAGEAGHMYFNCGLSLTSFDGYNGLQMGGHLTYGLFQWKAIPAANEEYHDARGYYLPLTMTIVKCKYYVTAASSAEYDVAEAISGKAYYIPEQIVEPTYYTVTFKDWDGTVLSTQTVEEGHDAVAPADPTREGYTFTGWDADFTNVQSDLVVNATYTVNSYTITYYVDGAAVHTDTYNYGAAVTPYEYTPAEGYIFNGWEETIPATMPAQNVEIHGTTSEIIPNSYTVTFKDWDGTVLSTQQVVEGEDAVAPAVPGREGYTFTGWDVDFTNVQSDLVVTAQYQINTYRLIIYYLKDTTNGAIANAVIVDLPYGTEYSYTSPTIEGWHLVNEDQAVISGTMPAHNVEIDVYYTEDVAPYEPVAPILLATTAELRERATEDGKKDLRFVFTVQFNDSCINYKGELVGPTTEYYEVVGFGCTLNAGNGDINRVGKSIYQINDDTFQFTTVITGISDKNFEKTITVTPYLTYALNGVEATVTGDAFESSVSALMNN